MSDDVVDRARSFLRAHTRGDLRFDEHLRALKYVFAPSGELIAPVMVAMLQSMDTVLFVPECVEDAMEVQVTLERFGEDQRDVTGGLSGGALADRWRIYHGDPPDVNWAMLDIDAARFQGMIIDGQALACANPLADDEARICRHMNEEHRDALGALCAHYASIEVESPVMVGIDPLGIDVRGRFEVIRVPSTESIETPENARHVLRAMAETARSQLASRAARNEGDA